MKKQPQPRLLTLDEVARIARVSKRTLYRKIKSGQLPAFDLGRLLVDERDLRQYIESRRIN